MIFNSQPLTCFGQVKAWRFWGEDRNGGIRLGVYRPDPDSANQFLLLGETEIPSGHSLSEVVLHEITDQNEWISFEPGDVIGFRQWSSGTNLRFDSSGTEIFAIKYTGHNDDNWNSYGPGDTFTVGSDLTRAYSMQAVISPKGR